MIFAYIYWKVDRNLLTCFFFFFGELEKLLKTFEYHFKLFDIRCIEFKFCYVNFIYLGFFFFFFHYVQTYNKLIGLTPRNLNDHDLLSSN